MGISGLLPALAEITTKDNIRIFKGKKAAIDAYCWLHRAAHQCSQELARGYGTEKLISYCVSRV